MLASVTTETWAASDHEARILVPQQVAMRAEFDTNERLPALTLHTVCLASSLRGGLTLLSDEVSDLVGNELAACFRSTASIRNRSRWVLHQAGT
jgi:hypothetical protein